MYNAGFEDDLYKDRNKSFRKAVRAPKKNQRYLANDSEEYNLEDASSKNGAVQTEIVSSHKSPETSKYNWKRFLPWAPKTKGYPAKHPVDDCGFIPLMLFSWATPIMKKGFKKPLEISDLGKLPRSDSAAHNYKRLRKFWTEEINNKGLKNASIGKTIFRTGRTRFFAGAILFLLSLLASFIGPAFMINRILKFVESKTDPIEKGVILVVALMICETARSWIQSLSFLMNLRTGTKARAMVWTIVYNKVSKLKNAGDKSIGELVNICASDAQRVFEAFTFGPFLVGGPVALIIVIAYTTYILGPSALLGCFIFLILFPIQAAVGKYSGKFRAKAVRVTDQRVKLMNEVLSCIKLIKMYAWEKSFAEVIGEIRGKEKTALSHSSVLQSLNISMTNIVSTFATVVTFIVHVYSGNDLLASQAFTVIAVFNTMIFAFAILPFAIKALAEAKVSMKRLKSLLEMEEYEPWTTKPADKNVVVEIKSATFGWNEVKLKEQKKFTPGEEKPRKGSVAAKGKRDSTAGRGGPPGRRGPAPEEFKTQLVKTLFDVNVTFHKGKLIGICGGVGSGKSSMINAILAQMNLVDGSVAVDGSIAYVAQQAWLMNATVKENIVFGVAFKPLRYQKVIEACSLKQDLDIFAHGDQTEIGERGINLSGGQKQRISLARAVYADKDIYLLDDPLSAVDSHVGQHIFNNCIKGALADKTIIFVTHQLQYLSHCDKVILLKDGRITEMGPYEKLLQDGKEFSGLVQSYNQTLEAEENEDYVDDDEDTSKILEQIVRKRTLSAQSIGDCQPSIAEEMEEINEEPKMNGVEKSKDSLMKAEDRKTGTVSFSTYVRYCKAAGGAFAVSGVLLMLFVITLLKVFTDFWLGRWINDGNGNSTESDENPGELNDNPDLNFYAAIYGSSLAVTVVLLVLKCFAYVNTVLRASSNLHNQVFRAVTKSPMEFFDTTPIGQILNRFSKDIDEIDTRLPFLVEALILNLSFLIVTIILLVVLFYWFLIALVFFIALFIFLNIVFRRSVRELKRLDNISRSPIFSHISASVQGLSTLHAYGKTDEFLEMFEKLLDKNTLPFFIFMCSHRWLAVRLDVITIGITTVTSLLVVLLRDSIPAAMGGLAITYAIRMSGLLQFTVRLSAETEAIFTSVERLVHYIDNLKQEAPSSVPDKKPADDWPDKGGLSILGLKMRYRENLPLVLKGITCNIKPKEKIGIVGRTGSGKSSIGVSLFRLVEPSGGKITIDGVNILNIGLDDLRTKLSIIPQDPILFIGTVRYNLDPFHTHTDEEVWIALERAHLKDTISNLPLKLQGPVVENGENFSVGERQLMCMARALLRNCKILMLDEATAAIDAETDAKIQDTIREAFKDCTMLTIAHRLNTVMDSDKIMVMEQGQIVEFDKPSALLANKSSLFSSLVAATEKLHQSKDS
ncbi:multidrug resistance-associated protein 5-like [Dendronephthya gigantea]|uniref:multidrug resistance-associated protein 5-like n=1 Tax=Dendronephthya gigantea TaxID=151771 RepID=UPI00106DA764|nr:multidrug resistance-associated protein 5-like [Dendronephthya gigantea]